MNQFKKAKLRAIETGHEIESVAVLQTAGIMDETNNDLKDNPSEPKNNKQENQDKIDVAVIANIETSESSQDIESKYDTKKTIIEEIVNIDVEEPIVQDVNETINELHNTTPDVIHFTESKKENEIDEIPIPVPVQVLTKESISNEIKEQIKQQILAEKKEEEQVIETSKNTRKNIPNIFAPKDEAKSMRKSLVLKPTSVKKAEMYCIKNGGSFNELVQTLLDNFISEYGL